MKPKYMLKTLMDERGLSTTKIGKSMGNMKYQVAAVRILNGKTKEPRRSSLQPFADFFGVSVDNFFSSEDTALIPLDNNVSPITDKRGNLVKMRYLPVVSWVQAGAFTEAIDNHAVGDADEWIAIVGNVGAHAFALKIEGDSMSPEFRPNEYVAVDPSREPKNGSFVVAKLSNDNVATFKQLVYDAGRMYLKPLNPQYPIIDVTDKEDLHICGVVIQKVMQYE